MHDDQETTDQGADRAPEQDPTPEEIDAAADQAAALAAAEEGGGDDTRGDGGGTDTTEPAGADDAAAGDAGGRDAHRDERGGRADPVPELLRLIDLAAKYPEIGPPLAELAFKIGHADIGERVVRMGLEGGAHGVEYYFVAASAARREGRHGDALARTLEAVRMVSAAAELSADDGARLLHLVRLGFSTLLFDVGDISAHPGFVVDLAASLPGLEPRLGADPFFHVLLAQTLWFSDRDASELEWDRAAELGEPEHTWNARGTWYKEAEHDDDKAERAYRAGLERAPQSALLLHNLAQMLVDKASRPDADVGAARQLLREADDLLRAALREDAPKGLRRHVHSTRDRLVALRSSLPRGRRGGDHREPGGEPEGKLPSVGDVVHGRVVSLAAYGAFVSVGRGHVGLLHKSEIAHERIDDPATALAVGDEVEVKVLDVEPGERGRSRIGLSRRALLPAPAGGERRPEPGDRGGRRGDRGPRGGRGDQGRRRDDGKPTEKFLAGGKVSLGEMILAKLKEQENK